MGIFREFWGDLAFLGEALGFLGVPRFPLEGLGFLVEVWGSLGKLGVPFGSFGILRRIGFSFGYLRFFREAWVT